jgi:hypothetical protein
LPTILEALVPLGRILHVLLAREEAKRVLNCPHPALRLFTNGQALTVDVARHEGKRPRHMYFTARDLLAGGGVARLAEKKHVVEELGALPAVVEADWDLV